MVAKRSELVDFLVGQMHDGVAPEFNVLWDRYEAGEEGVPNPNDFAIHWGSYNKAVKEIATILRIGRNPHARIYEGHGVIVEEEDTRSIQQNNYSAAELRVGSKRAEKHVAFYLQPIVRETVDK